jgi:tRNA threonylcarbamoyladenosine biosynthesis protein TsaB
MANILSIDTSNSAQIILSLTIDGKKDEVIEDTKSFKSQVALPLIEKLIKRNKLSIGEIDEIKLNKGPGSFTGLRVGASIANALSYLLKKPINDLKVGQIEEPVYNK